MDNRYRLITDEILKFNPKITFPAALVKDDFFSQLYTIQPKILAYTDGMQLNTTWQEAELTVKYQNKDIPPSEICICFTEQQVTATLCRLAGDFRKKICILAPQAVDFCKAYDRFHSGYLAFYPQLIAMKYEYWSNGKSRYRCCVFECAYRVGKVKMQMMEQEVNAEVDRLAAQMFLNGMPEEAKIYLVHNYLATGIEYYNNDDAKNVERSYIQSAYGALIKKKCVCQGIAEAFKRLLKKGGVNCEVVCGQIIGSVAHHAWNVVTLKNGKSYHFDATWDLSDGAPDYTYYAKADGFFCGKRTWSTEYIAKCNAYDNILLAGRTYIRSKKSELLNRGVSLKILDI